MACFGFAEKCCSLYVILCDCMKALRTVGLSLVLFGLHVIAHWQGLGLCVPILQSFGGY